MLGLSFSKSYVLGDLLEFTIRLDALNSFSYFVDSFFDGAKQALFVALNTKHGIEKRFERLRLANNLSVVGE